MPVHSSLKSPAPRSQSAFTAIGVRIPLRDGLSLHAAVWRPRGHTEPVSAVMELTPYGVDHLNEDGVFWAAEGFAYVAIDVRGRGNSDGDFVPFLRDASDGYDAVEWIAAQDWCDGKVALHGGSYTGVNQYLILAAAPPSLKAITPDSTSGFGVDLPRGGIPALYDFGWRRLVSNRGTQFTIAGDIAHWHRHLYDAAVAGTSLVEAAVAAGAPLDEWVLEPVDHAEPGPRWEVYWAQPEQLAATTVPVLSITGMYDDSSGGTIHNWRRFVRHAPADVVAASHLVVGPWDHMATHFGEGKVGELVFGPDAAVNLPELRRDWLRHILHGAPAPEFLRDRVMLYLAGAERWISASSLEQATTGSVTKYLRSADGPMDATHSGFVEDAPAASPDATFTCDPFDMRTHEAELQPRPAGSGPESPFHGQPMNNFLMSVAGNDPTNPRLVLDLDGQGVVYTSRILTDGHHHRRRARTARAPGVRPARRRSRGAAARDHADGRLDLPQQRRAATELPPPRRHAPLPGAGRAHRRHVPRVQVVHAHRAGRQPPAPGDPPRLRDPADAVRARPARRRPGGARAHPPRRRLGAAPDTADGRAVSDVVTLVTGAASGIGLACARRLVARGDRVVCADLSPDTPRLAAEIGAALGLVVDVASSAECDAAVMAAVEQLGHVDHLVAAAGIELTGPAHEMDDDTWHRVQRVNVDGCFFMARAVGRHLIGRGQAGASSCWARSTHRSRCPARSRT